jgi:hypothetical protein
MKRIKLNKRNKNQNIHSERVWIKQRGRNSKKTNNLAQKWAQKCCQTKKGWGLITASWFGSGAHGMIMSGSVVAVDSRSRVGALRVHDDALGLHIGGY